MFDQAVAFLDQASALYDRAQPFLILLLLLIIAVALLANVFLDRGLPRIGGKIGRRAADGPAAPAPDGFSRVDCREIVNFVATADAEAFASLRDYARGGTAGRPGLVHIYRIAGCHTRVEIPAGPPPYDRIGAAEALALLRELPDLRFVHRLHLSDEPSLLDPWVRKVTGHDFLSLGHATVADLVVLYRPHRQLGREIGLTLLHEWLHLVAFKSAWTIHRFKRADKVEPSPPQPYEQDLFGDPRTPTFESWCVLGEKLLGYDETVARQAALASPVHAMILWRCIARILRKTPRRFASTRLDEFRARAAFMRLEVAPRARAARARRQT